MIALARRPKLRILDLFCGAGGTSDGAVEAAEELGYEPELTAINHWDVAIETHMANHPTARTLLTAVDNVAPRDLYGPGELDLLWASPECTHHSVARGGRPINDQSRATAWCVVRFADALQPPMILVENVPEFVTWGGLCRNGRPLEKQKGKTFLAWIAALRSLGYRVDWRVLCAADQGDPTLRKRLIIQAVRGRFRNVWPAPTHAPAATASRLLLQPYVPAAKIIDWSIRGGSIFERERPLVVKTMRRILAGLEKFSLKPFLVRYQGDHVDRDGSRRCAQGVEEPIGTVTTENRYGLTEANFLVPPQGCDDRIRGVDKPLNTVTCEGNGLVQAKFIVEHQGTNDRQINGSARPTTEPLSTVSTSGAHHALSETHFLVQMAHGDGDDRNGSNRRVRGMDVPLPTVCGQRGDFAFVTANFGERDGQHPRTHDVNDPLPTVTSRGAGNLIETSLRPDYLTDREWAFWRGIHGNAALLPQQSGGAMRPVSEPAPTVAASGAIGMVDYIISIDHQSGGPNVGVRSADEPLSTATTKARHLFLHPFLVKYFGTGGTSSVAVPTPTVTTRERFSLAHPKLIHCGQGTFRRVNYYAWKRLILSQARRRQRLTRLYMQHGELFLMLEITHRMLQTPELAGAQGFRKDYKFCGNKTEQVRQIGNAVPRHLAKACVRSILTQLA